MHIVFVHTPVPHREVAGRDGYWQAFDRRYMTRHPHFRPMRKILWELPHWIPWLAGVLEHAGFNSMAVLELYTECATLDGIDETRILRHIESEPGDVYLFSPMASNLPQALRIAHLVKTTHPQSIVVFGGVAATPLDRAVAMSDAVDYVVRDRGEYALPALLTALSKRAEVERVGNLTLVRNGHAVRTATRYPAMPVHAIPFPKVDIFGRESGQDIRYLRQNYALGCPFTCDFCTIQTIGRSPDYFPVPRVLNEITAYRAHYGDHHHIYFGDETFTLHTDRTLKICAALAEHGGIEFDCQTRLNCLRAPQLPQALYDAGCRWVEIGLETANAQSQDLFKQHTDVGSLDVVLKRLTDAGIGTCTFLILGLPSETVDDMRRTVDRACSLMSQGLLTASYVSVFVPYPGTSMLARPADYGMNVHHHRYDLFHEDLPPVFDTANASSEQIYQVFLEAVSLFSATMAQA